MSIWKKGKKQNGVQAHKKIIWRVEEAFELGQCQNWFAEFYCQISLETFLLWIRNHEDGWRMTKGSQGTKWSVCYPTKFFFLTPFQKFAFRLGYFSANLISPNCNIITPRQQTLLENREAGTTIEQSRQFSNIRNKTSINYSTDKISSISGHWIFQFRSNHRDWKQLVDVDWNLGETQISDDLYRRPRFPVHRVNRVRLRRCAGNRQTPRRHTGNRTPRQKARQPYARRCSRSRVRDATAKDSTGVSGSSKRSGCRRTYMHRALSWKLDLGNGV